MNMHSLTYPERTLVSPNPATFRPGTVRIFFKRSISNSVRYYELQMIIFQILCNITNIEEQERPDGAREVVKVKRLAKLLSGMCAHAFHTVKCMTILCSLKRRHLEVAIIVLRRKFPNYGRILRCMSK